jgi:hypothetical protein
MTVVATGKAATASTRNRWMARQEPAEDTRRDKPTTTLRDGGTMALEHEMATYQANLLELLANEGKFVVILGEEIAGAYDTYEEALEAGYGRYGLVPFLVKKISRVEPIQYFSRDLPRCQP